MTQLSKDSSGALVWDMPTRLFHWGLLACVGGAFVSQWFYERIPFIVHEVCGASALVLVTFRFFWGYFGPRYARFGAFIRGPAETAAYLRAVRKRQPPAVVGHTPTGGWMILLLLLLIGLQAGLGLFANDETDAAGWLYGWVTHATSKQLTELHEAVANLLLAAIAVHVLAVIAYRVVLKEDLVRPMLTGMRRGTRPEDAIDGHRWLRAAAILALCAGALIGLIKIAPPLPDVLM